MPWDSCHHLRDQPSSTCNMALPSCAVCVPRIAATHSLVSLSSHTSFFLSNDSSLAQEIERFLASFSEPKLRLYLFTPSRSSRIVDAIVQVPHRTLRSERSHSGSEQHHSHTSLSLSLSVCVALELDSLARTSL